MEIIKFYPIHKPTIWGSETWIASAVKGDESIVSEGCYKGMSLTEIVERFGSAFLGEANSARFGKDFPLLMHIDEILTGGKEVNIPWEAFTFVQV